MYDRIVARLVEKNCRAYLLFTAPPTHRPSPRNPETPARIGKGNAA